MPYLAISKEESAILIVLKSLIFFKQIITGIVLFYELKLI
ncbi:MAG: hypothetical protein ACI9LN_003329, partial [Saprospiraceae bacterium]